ncbi:conserved hypothetical protein [Chloroherpeton thalassium ATCC 35110]|uniref:NYN domain-containing protein n=1 Tax=Chloroherpeton thalassium (strain ATCC 35110 / GB-78) TaxID=517418 RepID=B3QWS8_CHLT3|nr:NYN domain-containing protein [Chloroherpeton thalassium]ACF13292.1 conserved hypothetical protein [Chloroherpeton thalassium ATCC 35110]
MKTLLLVDGYNLAHKLGVKVSSEKLHAIRQQVEALVIAYCAAGRRQATIVYDGLGTLGSVEKISGLEIEFTPSGTTADSRIKAMIDDTRAKSRLLVVSSDHSIRHYAKVSGVKSIASEDFLREMAVGQAGKKARAIKGNAKHKKGNSTSEKPQSISEDELDAWLKLFGK